MKNLFYVIACMATLQTFAQKPIFTTSKVKSATVYYNSAELTHTASATLPAGSCEVVIKNVSNALNENTIQIAAPSNVTVLSAQFTNNYISEYEIDETNPTIKKVRDSIFIINKEIGKIANDRTSHLKTIELLDKNQNIAGANASINVQELIKLVDYYKSKRTELSDMINTLYERENKLKEKLAKLNSKLEINTKNQENISTGKLILQVMSDVAITANFEINYLTSNASWVPFYDLRASNVKSPIDLMYKARVVQQTGVDWKKVKLTLSSGIPNQNNQIPILKTWFLRFGSANIYSYNNSNGALNTVQAKAESVAYADEMRGSSVSDYTTINENQLNTSFDISIPYDILSNGKAHSVSLKEVQLSASYTYYAVPKLDKEAFLMAEITDYSKYNLLPGEANIIFEGMYVGKTHINPNETSDTLNLSMGRDKKISIKREKIADKSGTKFLSGIKEQVFTYDIIVRNNKKESIDIIIKDQYPVSTDKEIVIELLQSDKAKINEETGVLTWNVNLSANETKKFRISYKVKFPKDKNINNL